MRWIIAIVLTLAASALPAVVAAQEEQATFLNACQTTSRGGIYRWEAKTDTTLPGDQDQIQPTTVADMLSWTPLPGDWRTRSASQAGRQPGQEQQFFELVGAVQRVGLDPDGDVHLELADADDATLQRVIVEIPQGNDDSPFCAARQALFAAMGADPTGIRTGPSAVWAREPSRTQYPLGPVTVDVVGQGFYDGEHCDAQGVGHNHGTLLADATCWELHPLTQLSVLSASAQPDQTGTPAADAGAALSVPPSGQAARVTLTNVKGAQPRGMAHAAVQAAPGATCTIVYTTPAGTASQAQGLTTETADPNGVASWSWIIGPGTRRGTGSVSITCDGQTVTTPIQIG